MCGCGYNNGTIISSDHGGEGKVEYKFIFNDSRKSADVALVSGEEIEAIFEVVHSHYTRERDRPNPWFEIDAKEINRIESDLKKVRLTCLRQLRSPECLKAEQVRNERLAKEERKRIDRMSEHDRRFHEWVKMEDKRMAIIIANQEKEEKIKSEASNKILDEERNKRLDEERKLREKDKEYAKVQNEIRKKKEEELRAKDIGYKKALLEVSKQIAPCAKCQPFIRWTSEVKTWDWCRCHECKRAIKEKAKTKLATA
jgi:hypothetical protein